MKRFWITICVSTLVMAGCNRPSGWNEPRTKVSYGSILNGFSFEDTKDNDIEAHGEYNPETGQAKVDLKVRNNASDVNASQVALMGVYVEQMKLYNEEFRIHGENIQKALQELRLLADGLAKTGADVLNFKAGPDGLQGGNALAPARPTSVPEEPSHEE